MAFHKATVRIIASCINKYKMFVCIQIFIDAKTHNLVTIKHKVRKK